MADDAEPLVLRPFPEGHKRCSTCKRLKPFADFNRVRRGMPERANQCRACFGQVRAARIANGKEAAYQISRRDRLTDTMLRLKFGIGLADYAEMLAKQEGVCAICKQPEQSRAAPMRRPGGQNLLTKRLSVDHSHATGKVRGLLCSGCNPGIGHFRESPALLRAAADYLEHHAA